MEKSNNSSRDKEYYSIPVSYQISSLSFLPRLKFKRAGVESAG